MEHERSYSPEPKQSQEYRRPVFDLEQMTPEQATNLVAILGKASELAAAANQEIHGIDDLQGLIDAEISSLPERNLEKAIALYEAMAASSEPWPRAVISCYLGDLLSNAIDDEPRQQVIDLCVRLMNDNDKTVREFAEETIWYVVDQPWIDESAGRYFNNLLPVHLRAEIRNYE